MALRMPAFIYRHQVLRLRHERRIRRGRPPARCLVRRIGLRSLNNFAHVRHRRRHDSVPGTRDPPALMRPHEQRIHAGKYKEADDCGLQSSCWPSSAACRGLALRSDALRPNHPALRRPCGVPRSFFVLHTLRVQPPGRSMASEAEQRKQRLCAPFARGHCRLGARCPDRHSMDTSERYESACMFIDGGIVSGWPADPRALHVRRIPCDCPEKHDACADLPRYVHRCQRFREPPAHSSTRTLNTHASNAHCTPSHAHLSHTTEVTQQALGTVKCGHGRGLAARISRALLRGLFSCQGVPTCVLTLHPACNVSLQTCSVR
jgi:hypothetical protein